MADELFSRRLRGRLEKMIAAGATEAELTKVIVGARKLEPPAKRGRQERRGFTKGGRPTKAQVPGLIEKATPKTPATQRDREDQERRLRRQGDA